jgi:hypothetical protein
MPRTPITWSSAPFFWTADPVLDEKKLNSPQPCQHGVNCTYKKPGACCAFVHPGEQGTGRVLLPARMYMENGKQVYQPATVRLVGSSFYKRRRLGLSWPEWCQQLDEKARSEARPEPQTLQAPFAISNGMVVGSQPIPEVIQKAFLHAYQQACAAQDEITQQFKAYAAQQKEAEAVLKKQNLGNLVYAKVEPKLAALKADAEYSDNEQEAMVWPENMTAAKVTGMFFNAMDADELQQLLNDEVFFEEKIGEALEILHQYWETVNVPHEMSANAVVA